ncbi:MAG: hypothetical protein HYS21_07795 [Deltaproteobacteria bacterium]|nr:hypothetical protein [Deltaproteobacteria bacterium]
MEKIKNEKGFILILALITMLAMTLIGLSVVYNMNTDLHLSRNEREAKIAFQLAEAGVREAVARLHIASTNSRYIGEKSTDANYRTISWNSGNSLGRNFSSDNSIVGTLGTNQSYSVTIRYLDETNPEGFCDGNEVGSNISSGVASPPTSCSKTTAEVVMYGQDFNLDPSVTSIRYGQLPVYRIISTGTSNGTTRTIEAYLGGSNLNTDTEKAINTNACIDVAGGSNTITGDVVQGPGCGCDPQLNATCVTNKTASTDMNTFLGDTLANIKTYSDEVHKCTTATCNGAGDDIPASGALDNIVTAWEGAGPYESVLLYIENAGGKEVSISGNFTGEGILIVTGDLKISGSFHWEGLIYVLGTLTVSGGGSDLNVTGGVMANNTVAVNGGITINYDLEELLEQARQTSTSATMVWKRL